MFIDDINPYIRVVGEASWNFSFSPRYSRDCRLFYFTDGNGTIIINKNAYNIRKNAVVLIMSGIEYEIIEDTPISVIIFNFDYSQNFRNIKHSIKTYCENAKKEISTLENLQFEDFPALNKEIYLENASFLLHDINKIIEENRSAKVGYEALCSCRFKKIVCDIAREISTATKNSYADLETVISYVHDNYAENIDNFTISSVINYHPYYVNKLMVSYTGMTIHQYLNHYRLTMAAHYLSVENYPISQVCFMVGFQDPSHFSAVFKEKFAITPKEYRKLHRTEI